MARSFPPANIPSINEDNNGCRASERERGTVDPSTAWYTLATGRKAEGQTAGARLSREGESESGIGRGGGEQSDGGRRKRKGRYGREGGEVRNSGEEVGERSTIQNTEKEKNINME